MKDKIKEILSDVFGVSSDEFNANSILADFEAWDSLTHMELIVTIEKTCNFEMTFDEKVSGMKFDLGTPIITGVSERFDFEGYKYYMVYYSSTMKIQIVSEEYISNIENLKYVFESQYSEITDSFEFDSQTNTFTFRGLKQSMIASSQSDSDNWKYIEYKTDEQTKGMLMQIIPIEEKKKLTN